MISLAEGLLFSEEKQKGSRCERVGEVTVGSHWEKWMNAKLYVMYVMYIMYVMYKKKINDEETDR